MIKCSVVLLALVALPLLSVPSWAGKDSDELGQFGLVGSWALDCAKSPSTTNPFVSFTPSNAGQPTRQVITGRPQLDSLVPLSDVKMLDATHLRLSYPQGGVTVTVTLLKEQRRIRPFEAVESDGAASVRGGIVRANGHPTSWLLKCAD
jgi:hypothetical protein